MNVLFKIDDWLLNMVQSVSRRIQKITGANNFLLAKIILVVFTMILFAIANYNRFNPLLCITDLLAFFVVLHFIHAAERSCINDTMRGYMNYLSKNPHAQQLRLLTGVITGLVTYSYSRIFIATNETIHLYRIGEFVSFYLMAYLVSCTPMPPRTDKTISLNKDIVTST